jgi:hypothetical protein
LFIRRGTLLTYPVAFSCQPTSTPSKEYTGMIQHLPSGSQRMFNVSAVCVSMSRAASMRDGGSGYFVSE